MARKRGGNFSRYLKGAINTNTGLGTLAGRTVLSAANTDVVVDTMRVSSIRCTYAMNNFTPGVGQGPIQVGVAHSDYSSTEIEAFLEEANSWDVGDKLAKEVRSRLIRSIGIFDTPEDATKSARLNDGRPIRTKLNWVLAEGDTLRFWWYNTGNGNLATTAPTCPIVGYANLWVM